MCIWDKGGLGFPRPPRTNIFMLPLCNYCAFFATRVNKMAADAYCVKKLTFLLVVIDHCKIAHFFRLEKIRNFTLYEFFSKTNISPHFGGKHENQWYLVNLWRLGCFKITLFWVESWSFANVCESGLEICWFFSDFFRTQFDPRICE